MKKTERDADATKRQEILRRLQELPELRTTEASLEGFPKVPVSVLCDEGQFQKLKAILDWIVEGIRGAEGR